MLCYEKYGFRFCLLCGASFTVLEFEKHRHDVVCEHDWSFCCFARKDKLYHYLCCKCGLFSFKAGFKAEDRSNWIGGFPPFFDYETWSDYGTRIHGSRMTRGKGKFR
jgi:hypothetical protein